MEEERYKLDKRTLIDLFFDSVHLMILHYGLWFRETEHQIGLDKAIMADEIAWKQILSNQPEEDWQESWNTNEGWHIRVTG